MRIAATVSLLCLTLAVAAQDGPPGVREFFPYGVYISGNRPNPADTDTPPDEQLERAAADLEAHGFNCVWLNNLNYPVYLEPWLEVAERHNLRVVPQGGGTPSYLQFRGIKPEDMVRTVEETMKPFWFETARKYRDNDALLAYAITEEIPPREDILEAIRTLTHMVAQVDDRHPMIVLYNKATAAELAAQVVRPKAFGVDLYPFFANPKNGPTTPAGRYSYYSGLIRRMYEAARSCDAPLWVMAQGMNLNPRRDGEDLPDAVWLRPTPAQMRWQVWVALQNGAKGIFYFIYGAHLPDAGEGIHGLIAEDWQPTEIYETAADIHRELQPIIPLILRLEIAPDANEVTYWMNNEWVKGETFIDRTTNDRYLMLVNTDYDQPHTVDIELGRWPGYLGRNDILFDVRSQRQLTSDELDALELPPGEGTIVRIQPQPQE